MRGRLAAAMALCVTAVAQSDERKGGGVTIQLPSFGVAIDADGELTIKSFADPTGRLKAERIAAARAGLPADIAAASKLRKISLVRLEQAVAACLDEERPIDKALCHLAGLQRVQYAFIHLPGREGHRVGRTRRRLVYGREWAHDGPDLRPADFATG
jgi:hypothetical protein